MKLYTEECFGCTVVFSALLLGSCLLAVTDLRYRTGATALVAGKSQFCITNIFGWYQRDTQALHANIQAVIKRPDHVADSWWTLLLVNADT